MELHEIIEELAALQGFKEYEEAEEYYEDNYRGEFKDLADFAQQLYHDCYDKLPTEIEYYIDWERYGKDMDLSGDIFYFGSGDNTIHVFWN